MTGEREREEVEKMMKMIGPEGVLRECIHQTNRDILETEISLVVREMFDEELGKILKAAMPEGGEKRQNPISKMGMMMEGLIKATAKVIVMMSAINPLFLGGRLNLPEDQVRLLRRGVEDNFTELAGQLLKQHILNFHQDFTEFQEEKK